MDIGTWHSPVAMSRYNVIMKLVWDEFALSVSICIFLNYASGSISLESLEFYLGPYVFLVKTEIGTYKYVLGGPRIWHWGML